MDSAPHPTTLNENSHDGIYVDPAHTGERLDVFLAHSKRFFEILGRDESRSKIAKGIRNSGVTRISTGNQQESIRAVVTNPSIPLLSGDTLLINREVFSEISPVIPPEPDIPIEIVSETKNLLVLKKPAGIESHPTSHRRNNTVVNWLLAHYPELAIIGDDRTRPGIVHRLDRDTSGLLLIARTQHAYTALRNAFKNRCIQKRYKALISGIPRNQEGVINLPIARSSRGDRQSTVEPGKRIRGPIRAATTRYRTIETFENAALLELEPKTGRTHQIRVHLASIGHPVIGDRLYGKKVNQSTNIPPRHLLHAEGLSFSLFGENYEFFAPIPADFQHYLTNLRNRKDSAVLTKTES